MTYQAVEVNGSLSEVISDSASAYPGSDNHYSESAEDPSVQKIRVLLMDQSDAMLKTLKAEVEKDHHIKVIGMARNAHEARNMVIALDPDILVMDLMGPHSGGVEFLKRLKKFSPRPVLLITHLNKIPSDLARSAFMAGANDLIEKEVFMHFDSSILFDGLFLSKKIKAIASQVFHRS
jgi:chemotaxis response regulator CheB